MDGCVTEHEPPPERQVSTPTLSAPTISANATDLGTQTSAEGKGAAAPQVTSPESLDLCRRQRQSSGTCCLGDAADLYGRGCRHTRENV